MEGIGSSKLYYPLSQANVDDTVFVNDLCGIKMCQYLSENEQLDLGGSSGINCVGAYILAKKLGPGHTIVTFLCDGGEKYRSKIYNKEWLMSKGLYSDLDCFQLIDKHLLK